MSGSRKRKPGRWDRRSHRSENDRAMRAEADEVLSQEIPDHPLIPSDPPVLLTTAGELEAFAAHVRDVGAFAYDTEFIGEETYHPRLCLIQMATRDRVALLDPFDRIDLAPVWRLIADPEVETIVHAGQQDLEPVVRHLDAAPRNIFDTQIAAGFAGLPHPLGLRALVEESVGIQLGKALTFTNWDRRPLPEVHLRYAADDVRYLPAVRARIGADLERLGHVEWAREELRQFEDRERYVFDHAMVFRKALGNKRLKKRPLGQLWAIVGWRDRVSREDDVPPRALLKDDVLLRVIEERAGDPRELAAVRGFPRPLAERRGRDLLDVLDGAGTVDPSVLARGRRRVETPEDRTRIEGLLAVATCLCVGRSIAPSLAFNRGRIEAFHGSVVDGDEHPGAVFGDGWRRKVLGDPLEAFVRGDDSIAVAWRDGVVVRDRIARDGPPGSHAID